jgi:hypothetical protein
MMASNISDMEHACSSHHANTMSILLLQKKKIDSLELEINKIHNLTLSPQMENFSMASNK